MPVAFISASQDVVIDAYRTDLLPAAERGLGSSLAVLGYRLAMILSGGVALIWADPRQGGGWSWPEVYRLMAGLMVVAAAVSALLAAARSVDAARAGQRRAPRPARFPGRASPRWRVGYVVTDRAVAPLAQRAAGAAVAGQQRCAPTLQGRWADLVALLLGIAFTLPLAAWAARRARFETLLGGPGQLLRQPGARAFLLFIVLYKLGDAFAGSLMTPFLLQGMAFSPAEVGVVNKVIGLWLTIGGALIGGALMLAPRPVARAAAVRRAADAQQPRLLVAGGERPGR